MGILCIISGNRNLGFFHFIPKNSTKTSTFIKSFFRLINKEGVIVSHDWESVDVNSGYQNKTPCNVLIESPL